MSDVFGRGPGDERLDAEVSAALAARVHHRSRVAVWMGRLALAVSLLLAVVTVFVVVSDRVLAVPASSVIVTTRGAVLLAVALVVTVASVVLVALTSRRTRRLLEASAPEGGIVMGMSAAGVNLTHLPLLEWDTISAIAIAERATKRGREVTVGLGVADVEAARARIIDARLTHLVRPFPRGTHPLPRPPWQRDRDTTEAGFLAVDIGDLLAPGVIDEVLRRIEEEADQRDIPLSRVADRRRLQEILRPAPASAV